MQYSPKLKKAMEEVKEILRKHDIAASVVLHAPGFCEYLVHITPSYSTASIDPLKNTFQLKAKRIHFANDADRLNKLTDTANMLDVLSSQTGRNALMLMDCFDAAKKVMDIESGPENHTGHTTQNN